MNHGGLIKKKLKKLINNKITMSNNQANLLMLIATFIWGTAFVSQTTGMGSIGPFTFSFARFFYELAVDSQISFFEFSWLVATYC